MPDRIGLLVANATACRERPRGTSARP